MQQFRVGSNIDLCTKVLIAELVLMMSSMQIALPIRTTLPLPAKRGLVQAAIEALFAFTLSRENLRRQRGRHVLSWLRSLLENYSFPSARACLLPKPMTHCLWEAASLFLVFSFFARWGIIRLPSASP